MQQWHKLIGGGALALVLVAGAAPASALPVIDTWNYELNNGFDNIAPSAVVEVGNNPVLSLPTRVEWPVSFSGTRSALEVDSVTTGTVDTNGGPAPGSTLTHFNFPIPTALEDEFLTSGTLRVQLDLTPNTPPEPGAVGPISTQFDFLFKETRNIAPCPFPSGSVCDDIFLLVGTGDTSQEFTFLGETYTAIFGAEPLAPLDAATCGELGLPAGCIGFLTAENGETPFPTFIEITHEQQVPEPGMLALLGTGLVAIGVIRRRSKKAAA